jgi:hypothetical protein
MFGRGEITTKGTIVDCQTSFGGPQDTPRSEIVVDVQTPEGPVERVSFKQQLNGAGYLTPDAGAVVTVKWNPKNHQARLDLRGDPRYDYDLVKRQQKTRLDAEKNAPPGTAPNETA